MQTENLCIDSNFIYIHVNNKLTYLLTFVLCWIVVFI